MYKRQVFTMYEGWDAEKEKQGRSSLVGKTMLVGMEKSVAFHEKREACIRKKYDADEIGQRIPVSYTHLVFNTIYICI